MKRFLVLLTIALALLAVPAAAQDRGAVSGAEAAIGELVSESGSLRSELIPLFLVVTVLSLAPGIAIMVTCFPFMAIVFSFLRQAIGLQHAPPAMMLTSLALFLTFFVMEPVFSTAWQEGLKPLMDGAVDETAGIAATLEPLRVFMEARTPQDVISRLSDAAQIPAPADEAAPLSLLVPSFMLSEITRAFQIGFAIFLPFLVIDLVVASVLMAMGMMMVPPAVVALPFKLAFFVIADGWVRITEALLRGYIQ
ncbi:flagellar type III secretion system pore protein FliP [Parvularcula oceani]|uniref:flagellar type III secretion system pore protein FliP n=1 Tax=Parvularcula oceani TaxID=1247963 RepID=UPI0004E1F189|nr:flagellar type III secretion system pore protein FliP [Parvularcula oceani]